MKEKRRCEILSKDKTRESIDFMSLKKGDVFLLFDDTENPVEVGVPSRALSDPYLTPHDFIETIEVAPIESEVTLA